jgi:hypothetical protein
MKLFGILMVAVILIASVPVFAEDVQTVESKGEAAILNNDKAMARDKALEDAQRKAVESAVGTMISSETVTENYQLISDRILSKADGYVRKFKITNERAEENVYIVEISAEVTTGKLSSDLDGLQNLLRRKGMPKIIVMVAEQNVGIDHPQYWWGPQGITSLDMRVVENTLMEKMREKGFTFVDPEVLSGKKSVTTPIAFLSDKQARNVAKVTDAELILVGKAVAQDIGETMEGTRLRSARAEVSVRAINTDNGEIIAIASSEAVVPNISSKAAGSQALKKASQKLADDIVDKIAKKWVSDTTGSNRIRMTVTGISNNKMLSKFVSVLQEQVRGIKEVHQQSLRTGTAMLDVMLSGDTRSMATELEAKNFGGGFKIEVEEVLPNAIKVKLIP